MTQLSLIAAPSLFERMARASTRRLGDVFELTTEPGEGAIAFSLPGGRPDFSAPERTQWDAFWLTPRQTERAVCPFWVEAVLRSNMMHQFVVATAGSWSVDIVSELPLPRLPDKYAFQLEVLMRRRTMPTADQRRLAGAVERVVLDIYGLGTDDAMTLERLARRESTEESPGDLL